MCHKGHPLDKEAVLPVSLRLTALSSTHTVNASIPMLNSLLFAHILHIKFSKHYVLLL